MNSLRSAAHLLGPAAGFHQRSVQAVAVRGSTANEATCPGQLDACEFDCPMTGAVEELNIHEKPGEGVAIVNLGKASASSP
jgi:hypothetical protein